MIMALQAWVMGRVPKECYLRAVDLPLLCDRTKPNLLGQAGTGGLPIHPTAFGAVSDAMLLVSYRG